MHRFNYDVLSLCIFPNRAYINALYLKLIRLSNTLVFAGFLWRGQK